VLRLTVDGRDILFDDKRLLNTEAIALKKSTGLNVQDMYAGVAEFDAEALTALVWLALRRAGQPGLKYSDTEFDLGALDLVELDDEGRAVTRDKSGAITHIDGEPVPNPEAPEGA
jgi:hypothetical protein